VDLWWTDCSLGKRVNQKPRKEYRRRRTSERSESNESKNELDLQQWDDWFHDDNESISYASSPTLITE